MFGLESTLSLASFTGISGGDMIPLVAITGGLLVGVIAIVAGTINSISSRKQREESRREIAAYVAEGSMTPEDAERILKAGVSEDESPTRRCT